MLTPVRAHLFVREVRMNLDLIHRGDDRGLLREAVEVRGLEVRYADAAGASIPGELLENTPGGDEITVGERREWPVDEEQVDVVGSQRVECAVERTPCIIRLVETVVQLAGDVDVGTVHPCVADTLADFPFVSIHLGRVDVPVSRLQRSLHRRSRLLGLDLKYSESKLRDARTVVQFDVGNVAHQ